ncbi:MAG TPA: outer membrane protein [Xanthobacteraceae bacterium]|nr:outer membrane protein [Xanthobacteraceae bacterium]
MKKLLLAGGSLLILATGASAADLPRAPVAAPMQPAPVMARVYDWTGFYVGGNIGWGWASASGTNTVGGFPGTISSRGDGFLGGVQAGYNWQTGNIVFGVETDIQATGGNGNFSGAAGPFVYGGEARSEYLGTIRGRLGFAADTWLFYVTGGAAYGENRISGTIAPGGAFSSRANYWTWTLGAGVETALWDNWTVKAEYLYVDKPSRVPVVPFTSSVTGDARAHVARIGVNYRF